MKKTNKIISVNGIDYKKPEKPTIIICMDGVSQQYIEEAIDSGKAPTFEKFKNDDFYEIAKDVIPSYTNPNNISIITGVLPNIHGITTSGLSFNRKNGEYEIISSPEHIRCDTILQGFYENGIKVASVTTKDKLRFLLSKGWDGINISAEVAHQFEDRNIEDIIKESIRETKEGELLKAVDNNWMYSENSSLLSFDLAINLLQGKGPYIPKLMYISLTDYIPHSTEPGTEIANSFINGIDKKLGILDEMGCVIGITADHGMSNKHNPDGSANAIWLKDILEKNNIKNYNILLAVADKYLKHHSCLGSCAWIYFKNEKDIIKASLVLKETKGLDGVLFNKDAAIKYNLPEDLIGDLFLLSNKESVLGTTISEHPNIPIGLRSHGGLYEQKVPFIINKNLNREYRLKNWELRNFNIFEYALNGV